MFGERGGVEGGTWSRPANMAPPSSGVNAHLTGTSVAVHGW
jgi:hypothetical protein